jgi:hypothetical protein
MDCPVKPCNEPVFGSTAVENALVIPQTGSPDFLQLPQ